MKNKKEIEEELEALAPSFSKMEKEEVFKVPDNYFNELSDQIMGELNFPKEEIVVGRKESWWTILIDNLMSLLQPRIAVGLASLMLMFGSIFYLMNRTGVEDNHLAKISAEEASLYILENIDDFEDELLYDIALEVENIDVNNFEEKELNEYLDDIIDDMEDDELEELL